MLAEGFRVFHTLLERLASYAARLFSKAAARVPPDHDQARGDYLHGQADALYRQGAEKGDNLALQEAIDRYRDLVADTSRREQPLDWAMTQNNLGTALWTLGERKGRLKHLTEARRCIEAQR